MKNFIDTDILSCADGIFFWLLHARILGFCGWSRMDGAEAGIIACNLGNMKSWLGSRFQITTAV
jgi:hypothetical protein